MTQTSVSLSEGYTLRMYSTAVGVTASEASAAPTIFASGASETRGPKGGRGRQTVEVLRPSKGQRSSV